MTIKLGMTIKLDLGQLNNIIVCIKINRIEKKIIYLWTRKFITENTL